MATDKDTAMSLAIMEAQIMAYMGEPVSDFMESFPPVRRAMEFRASVSALCATAQTIVDQWDTPLWKQTENTGGMINSMRYALLEMSTHMNQGDK